MREWLVIESAYKNAVFAPPGSRECGYIPRDVAEQLLGRKIQDGVTAWFTREESDKLHASPEWRNTEPQ
jgi:hypothetical protein